MMNLCPCSSRKLYKDCCQPYHDNKDFPKTALQLMRSRYAAYALNLSDYIIKTTHISNPCYNTDKDMWRKEIESFSKEFIFEKLKVVSFEEDGNVATVTFTAYLSQDGEDRSFSEKSFFEKVNGHWFYRDGVILK